MALARGRLTEPLHRYAVPLPIKDGEETPGFTAGPLA